MVVERVQHSSVLLATKWCPRAASYSMRLVGLAMRRNTMFCGEYHSQMFHSVLTFAGLN